MNKIVIASNNQGKIQEIKEIFKGKEILSLKQIECQIEVKEEGKTFEENAVIKAKETYDKIKLPCIADDSGLCIKSLNNYPGIYTNRFLGENKTDKEKNEYLIEKLKNKEDRTATFECNVVYYNGSKIYIGKGILKGKIAKKPKGKNGFGFDEIFELENGKTLAELTKEEKNKVSARKIALEDLKQKMEKWEE